MSVPAKSYGFCLPWLYKDLGTLSDWEWSHVEEQHGIFLRRFAWRRGKNREVVTQNACLPTPRYDSFEIFTLTVARLPAARGCLKSTSTRRITNDSSDVCSRIVRGLAAIDIPPLELCKVHHETVSDSRRTVSEHDPQLTSGLGKELLERRRLADGVIRGPSIAVPFATAPNNTLPLRRIRAVRHPPGSCCQVRALIGVPPYLTVYLSQTCPD